MSSVLNVTVFDLEYNMTGGLPKMKQLLFSACHSIHVGTALPRGDLCRVVPSLHDPTRVFLNSFSVES